jgi:drug/metabolite transporter (DMT)-like permease
MAVLLALVTSVLYGTGDFFGGLATKRNNALLVLLVVQGTGGLALAATITLYGATFSWSDVAIGAAAGLFGLLGLALLYRGLATGPMAVVAPLTALTAAIVPVLWDLAKGGRPSTITAIGMVVGLASILVVSMGGSEAGEDGARSSAPVTVTVVSAALLSGVGFGMFFSVLSETGDDAAPWPILGARVVSVSFLLLLAFVRRVPIRVPHDRGVMMASGVCDTGANVTFLFALRYGALAPVAVLSSLYPAVTVVWARLVLGEQLDRRKLIGLAASLVAVGLIAGG